MPQIVAIIILSFLMMPPLMAQDMQLPERKFGDPFILLRKEATIGISIHSGGWGVSARRAKHITGFKKRILEFELAEMKHQKEYKIASPWTENGKTYVYGKLNSLFLLRTGLGKRKVIFSKAERGGVEVNYVFILGSSLGLAKPFYLNVEYKKGEINAAGIEVPSNIVVVEKYDPNNKHHIPDNIEGRSGFVKGIDEVKFHPGLYSKLGFNFDWCGYDEGIKSLEFGVSMDAFAREIPIMAITENKQFFVSFYVSLIYGKKWN